MTSKIQGPSPAPRPGQTPDGPPRTLQSRDLMQGCSQIEIVHRGEVYRLRITRQDKLILTK